MYSDAAESRHRRTCSRSKAARKCRACRACVPSASTTSWCRSPSFAPGPIVGQMVNPFLQRRQGREAVTYPHPSLEPVLKRTLGVPLFQEQLLRIAMIAANFTGGEAEELRRAMGFKRSQARMKEIEAKTPRRHDANGISPKAQEEIILSITSFALYGFPESHAASFALIAYASAYLKCHYLARLHRRLAQQSADGILLIPPLS